MIAIEGYVWCDKYEEVHSDSLNPNGYVEDGRQDYCLPEQHHTIYRETARTVSADARISDRSRTVHDNDLDLIRGRFLNLYHATRDFGFKYHSAADINDDQINRVRAINAATNRILGTVSVPADDFKRLAAAINNGDYYDANVAGQAVRLVDNARADAAANEVTP